MTGHFGFMLEENLGDEIHMYIVTPSFLKSSVFKMFLSTLKRKAGVFKFLHLYEV